MDVFAGNKKGTITLTTYSMSPDKALNHAYCLCSVLFHSALSALLACIYVYMYKHEYANLRLVYNPDGPGPCNTQLSQERERQQQEAWTLLAIFKEGVL